MFNMTLSIIHHEHDCVVSEDPYSHYKWAMQFVFVWFADTEVQCMCGFCEHVANSRYVCVYIYIEQQCARRARRSICNYYCAVCDTIMHFRSDHYKHTTLCIDQAIRSSWFASIMVHATCRIHESLIFNQVSIKHIIYFEVMTINNMEGS